ncbi:MAG: shikimate dehydrogenase, partial [Mesorhizobium sp.]
MSRYRPATQPTFYFIGVTTTSSSIMRVFPAWARHLRLKDAVLKGIDFPLHADPE